MIELIIIVIIIVIALLIILIPIFEIISYFFIKNLARIRGPIKEFPKIDEEALPKFTSFDPQLGWERQPNESRKKDVGHQLPDDPSADTVVYSTDKYGSRICPKSRRKSKFKIATFGDSYCFCRDVKDEQTFQYYLAQSLDIHVSNYGVGNYGLGQSLMRLKRRFEADPAKYVIMAFTSGAVGRILSVWKHYFEFGNTFAVKPRYKHNNNKDLIKIPCVIDKKEELLTLEEKADFLHKYDYHYENWFKKKSFKKSYTLSFLQDSENIPYAASTVLAYLGRELNINNLHNFFKYHRDEFEENKKLDRKLERLRYLEKIADQYKDLYCDILQEYSSFLNKYDSIPVYLPLYNKGYVKFEQERGAIDEPIISQLKNECSDLYVLDNIRDSMINQAGNISDLYIGAHHSPKANKMIAQKIEEFIIDHEC